MILHWFCNFWDWSAGYFSSKLTWVPFGPPANTWRSYSPGSHLKVMIFLCLQHLQLADHTGLETHKWCKAKTGFWCKQHVAFLWCHCRQKFGWSQACCNITMVSSRSALKTDQEHVGNTNPNHQHFLWTICTAWNHIRNWMFICFVKKIWHKVLENYLTCKKKSWSLSVIENKTIVNLG